MPELTQEELKRLLHYDPHTGYFTWLVRNSNRRLPGSRAGSIEARAHGRSYVFIRINKRCYRAHALAYFYMTGRWPVPEARAPHLDNNGINNAWSNIKDIYEAYELDFGESVSAQG